MGKRQERCIGFNLLLKNDLSLTRMPSTNSTTGFLVAFTISDDIRTLYGCTTSCTSNIDTGCCTIVNIAVVNFQMSTIDVDNSSSRPRCYIDAVQGHRWSWSL